MIVQTYLHALRQLPFASLERITGGGPILVMSPHPDDESLGCGGLIAAASEAGQRVSIVTLTDGSGSHPNSARYPAGALVALRRAESVAAAAQLGVGQGDLSYLDLPDAAAPMGGPAFEAAVDRLDATIRDTGAVALLVTSRLDPHCDHEAAATMAGTVAKRHPTCRVWHYPIWSWHLPSERVLTPPVVTQGVRFDVSPVLDRKRAAIACHASQMTKLIDDDPEGFCFTPETLAPFLRNDEVFIAVDR